MAQPRYNTEPQFVRQQGTVVTYFDEQGQPYYQLAEPYAKKNMAAGARYYIDPRQAAQGTGTDPTSQRLHDWAGGQGVTVTRDGTGGATMTKPTDYRDTNWMGTRSVWNPTTGRFERDVDRTFLAVLAGAGGVIGAGGAAALAGGGGAAVPGVEGASTVAGSTAPSTASLLGAAPAGSTLAGGSIPLASAASTAGAPGLASTLGASAAGGGMNVGNMIRTGLDIWGAAGDLASGAAENLASDRENENDWRTRRDQLLALIAGQQFNSDLALANSSFSNNLQGAEFSREGQSREMRQALLSAVLGGAQDARSTPGNPRVAARMGTQTGGARPSMLAGSRGSLMELLGRPQTAAPTFAAPAPYQAPTLSNRQESGNAEDILAMLGIGGSAYDAYKHRNDPKTR